MAFEYKLNWYVPEETVTENILMQKILKNKKVHDYKFHLSY